MRKIKNSTISTLNYAISCLLEFARNFFVDQKKGLCCKYQYLGLFLHTKEHTRTYKHTHTHTTKHITPTNKTIQTRNNKDKHKQNSKIGTKNRPYSTFSRVVSQIFFYNL